MSKTLTGSSLLGPRHFLSLLQLLMAAMQTITPLCQQEREEFFLPSALNFGNFSSQVGFYHHAGPFGPTPILDVLVFCLCMRLMEKIIELASSIKLQIWSTPPEIDLCLGTLTWSSNLKTGREALVVLLRVGRNVLGLVFLGSSTSWTHMFVNLGT